MNIAGYAIGPDNPPFTLAEVGLNHNGDLGLALDMIHVAKRAGCSAVKFQTFRAEGVCPPGQMYTYLSRGREVTEERINIFRRAELPEDAWPKIKAECDRQGIVFLSTPQNPSDLDILMRVGIPAIKIGSDDAQNRAMLAYCSQPEVGLPILLSTGMSTLSEITLTYGWLARRTEVAVPACTSIYPCPPEHANVQRVAILRRLLRCPVGWSDHTQGTIAATLAVALGASLFECHFTLDHNAPGPDHGWSRSPDELGEWVAAINEGYMMRGNGYFLASQSEVEAKAGFQRKGIA